MLMLILLAQATTMVPLPAAAEPAFDRYGKCVSGNFYRAIADGGNSPSVPTAMRKAIAGCAETRSKAIMDADKALSGEAAYADPVKRRAFLLARFDETDAVLREVAAGGIDPDKW